MTQPKKNDSQNAPRGHSRAAQNRKMRRDSLREELQAREYVRQLHRILERLDPGAAEHYLPQEVAAVKARADIYCRLLDKCLPSLRPVDLPVSLPHAPGLADHGRLIIEAMVQARITPDEAATVLQAIATQARVVEVDELDRRVAALETSHASL